MICGAPYSGSGSAAEITSTVFSGLTLVSVGCALKSFSEGILLILCTCLISLAASEGSILVVPVGVEIGDGGGVTTSLVGSDAAVSLAISFFF